jgi:hypothetical protein
LSRNGPKLATPTCRRRRRRRDLLVGDVARAGAERIDVGVVKTTADAAPSSGVRTRRGAVEQQVEAAALVDDELPKRVRPASSRSRQPAPIR